MENKYGDNRDEFWNTITTICIEKMSCKCALVDVLLDLVRGLIPSASSTQDELKEMEDLKDFYLGKLAIVIMTFDKDRRAEEKRMILTIMEKFLTFCSDQTVDDINKYFKHFTRMHSNLFKSDLLVAAIVFDDNLGDLFLRKYSF